MTPSSRPDSAQPQAARSDELKLAQRLMSIDTSEPEGIRACVGFLQGWLEARSIEATEFEVDELPVLCASVGEGPVTLVFHAHIDVVPGRAEQFMPWLDGDTLRGRGAYDMKGATAAMFCALADIAAFADDLGVRVRLLVVPDEESDAVREQCASQVLVERGFLGDFVVCGEPTDMHVGIQAKGVLDVRIEVDGVSAHGATPWLGVNAIVRAIDIYDQLLLLPFARESSAMFDRPSVNLGRIHGGNRLNQVPDSCLIEVDVRYLPNQSLDDIRAQINSLSGCRVSELFARPSAKVDENNPFLLLLRDAIEHERGSESVCVGRDGTNDGIHFLQRGIPSVEFGPVGGGHHGPEEWLSVESLAQYRRALVTFVRNVGLQSDVLTGITVTRPRGDDEDEPRSLL